MSCNQLNNLDKMVLKVTKCLPQWKHESWRRILGIRQAWLWANWKNVTFWKLGSFCSVFQNGLAFLGQIGKASSKLYLWSGQNLCVGVLFQKTDLQMAGIPKSEFKNKTESHSDNMRRPWGRGGKGQCHQISHGGGSKPK